MGLIQYVMLATGLSMDSLVVALASGAIVGNHAKVSVLKIAGMLAVVQMMLTLVGGYIGSSFADHIAAYDHWVAFGILSFLGVKVILEAFQDEKSDCAFNPLNIKVMLGISVATSIDALAVGLSLSIINRPLLFPALVIGFITFAVASLGVFFGVKAGVRYNQKINLIGGIILLCIGVSILLSHTLFL